MSRFTRGTVVALALSFLTAGCGSTRPARVLVPNVIGVKANAAVEALQRAKLEARLSPEPENRDLCRVSSERPTGELPVGAPVSLTLRCLLVVPNVVGDATAQAESKLQGVGPLNVLYKNNAQPSDPQACTVTHQSDVGPVEADTDIVLGFQCPQSYKSAVEAAARVFKR